MSEGPLLLFFAKMSLSPSSLWLAAEVLPGVAGEPPGAAQGCCALMALILKALVYEASLIYLKLLFMWMEKTDF